MAGWRYLSKFALAEPSSVYFNVHLSFPWASILYFSIPSLHLLSSRPAIRDKNESSFGSRKRFKREPREALDADRGRGESSSVIDVAVSLISIRREPRDANIIVVSVLAAVSQLLSVPGSVFNTTSTQCRRSGPINTDNIPDRCTT